MTRILYGEILAYLLPATMIDLARRIAGGAARLDSEIARLLSAQWRKRLAASNRAPLSMAPDGRENRWRLMNNWHIASRAEEWAHIGARNGLAFAFPLLDRRVVEYALSLPSTHFLRDGFRRRPFRDAMVGVLPERVRLRHQKYAPFPSSLLSLAERKTEFLQMIAALEKKSRVRGLLDLAHLRKKVEAFPAPEVVRDKLSKNELPRDAASMVAVVNALSAAAYLEQHGTGGTSEGTDAPR